MKQTMLFLFLAPLILAGQQVTQLAKVNGTIYATAEYGGITIIGGKFSTVNGSPANNIAWSTDQINWSPMGNGVNDTVKDIKYFNGDFFICGTFSATGTLISNFIVRWNPISNLFIPLQDIASSMNGIEHLAVVDTSLYISGRNWGLGRYAPYAPTGFPQIQSNPNITFGVQGATIYDIATDGTNLYVFFTEPSSNSNSIGKLSGTAWSSFVAWGVYTPYIPAAMALYNDTIYIAGSSGVLKLSLYYVDTIYHQSVNSLMVANNLLWFANSSVYTSTGTAYQPFLTTNGIVYSMMADSSYYFAGNFSVVNGLSKNSFVKYELIALPVAKATVSDSILCQNSQVGFSSISTGQYTSIQWMFSGGNPIFGQSDTELVTYNTGGVYPAILIATNAAGSDTAYYTISVGNAIHLTAPSSISYCDNMNGVIAVTGLNSLNGSFHWFPTTGISNSADSFTFNANAVSSYMICASDYGCADTVTIAVNVFPTPAPPTISQTGHELESNKPSGNQWYFNTGVLTDSTTQNIFPSQGGDYSIVYTDVNGCSSSSNQFSYSLAGIEDIILDNTKIYPNPTFGLINTGEKFRLADNQGQIVGYFDKTADLSALPPGIYFITIGDSSYKIVKK